MGYNELSNIYVVGACSGLGKYLSNRFDAIRICRNDKVSDIEKSKPDDTVVYTAFNSKIPSNVTELLQCIEDNLLSFIGATENLKSRLIYISSIDVLTVYEQYDQGKTLPDCYSSYVYTKLAVEQYILKNITNSIIIRPSAMVGEEMKANTTFKLFKKDLSESSLMAESLYSYLHYSTVHKLIDRLIGLNFSGTIDITASDRIKFSDVVSFAGIDLPFEYGDYKYFTPAVDISIAEDILGESILSSLDALSKCFLEK